ncbi:helix-turn-helix transcriptional regulator [Silvimonas sp.]|uniref:helix-turn-helix domain-containing protein n=1 Tax=Silvimonas sp. TaxID=2650811 RepID=UPI0028447D6A|nr:helix-turn-helix transcriptional regulator [Silvimonas sp.]MDR3426113.1 helix-turn-helix transcriptional regulator [Silvimonas sp.]
MAKQIPDIKKTLALNLAKARARYGLSQDALAKSSGIRRTYIALIEHPDGHNARFGTVEKLARGLGCDARILLGVRVTSTLDSTGPSLFKCFVMRSREARIAAGLSQEGLSETAGFFRTYVGRMETTATDISIKDAASIADTLGMSLGRLLK